MAWINATDSFIAVHPVRKATVESLVDLKIPVISTSLCSEVILCIEQ